MRRYAPMLAASTHRAAARRPRPATFVTVTPDTSISINASVACSTLEQRTMHLTSFIYASLRRHGSLRIARPNTQNTW